MLQRILSLAIVLGVILWIILSYLPDSVLPLPAVGYPGSGRIWASLAVAGLVAFLIIQTILVRSTAHSITAERPIEQQPGASQPPFRLNRGLEIFWTALPLAMTLALAWASYALWSAIAQP